jgi:FMN phosphatase YigB (HAD superfamily)
MASHALICDLDNTLFDAVRAWAEGFGAMVREIESSGLIDRAALLREFKRLHVAHGTTELRDALSLLLESPLSLPHREWRRALAAGGRAYRLAYAHALRLYPGVGRTLGELRRRGLTIIGYTESATTIAEARVRYLGLDGLIDTLFVSPDPVIDPARIVHGFALWPLVTLRCRIAHPQMLPPELVKPDPQALFAILADSGVAPHRAIYIGDHLHKDIPMAAQAGVISVWARYGTHRLAADVALIEEVCHWPVSANRGDQPIAGLEPRHTIDAFPDLFTLSTLA